MTDNALLYRVKRIFLTFTVILLSLCSYAQEHWDTYLASYDGQPGSVLVDMGLMPTAPDKKYQYLVITGPRAEHCDKRGMPTPDEIDALEEVLDATTNFITGVTAKVLAGTFTHQCDRLNYYYVKDTMGIRNAIGRLYNRTYKGYRYTVIIRPDPEWKTYRTFLYPDDSLQDWMRNNATMSRMTQSGDSLKVSRPINFRFYFTSDSARRSFTGFAQAHGYNIVRSATGGKAPNQMYGVIVAKEGNVRKDVDKYMAELRKKAKELNGTFEDWDAPLPALDPAK